MRSLCRLLLVVALLATTLPSFACGGDVFLGGTGQSCPRSCGKETCCSQMGGISYCDSSAGRYVCNNGYYSSCYCTRHAVMDLQKVQGCCLWQGGVMTIDGGLVICNNGGVSELCSLQNTKEVSSW